MGSVGNMMFPEPSIQTGTNTKAASIYTIYSTYMIYRSDPNVDGSGTSYLKDTSREAPVLPFAEAGGIGKADEMTDLSNSIHCIFGELKLDSSCVRGLLQTCQLK